MSLSKTVNPDIYLPDLPLHRVRSVIPNASQSLSQVRDWVNAHNTWGLTGGKVPCNQQKRREPNRTVQRNRQYLMFKESGTREFPSPGSTQDGKTWCVVRNKICIQRCVKCWHCQRIQGFFQSGILWNIHWNIFKHKTSHKKKENLNKSWMCHPDLQKSAEDKSNNSHISVTIH